MTLELKLKRAALNAAVDITLKGMKRSPERCARNLIELGISAFPNLLSEKEKNVLYDKILIVCKNVDINAAKELFFQSFNDACPKI